MGVSFGLAEYNTGDHILDLPVLEGASWAAMLNRPDSVSCEVDMRDREVRALDIPSATEPRKTVLFAESDNGGILAWGVISSRHWSEDGTKLSLSASGGWQYFNGRIIAPPAAATAALVDGDGKVVATYDTEYTNTTLGSIGSQLVAQALSWPGAPVAFVVPAPVAGDHDSGVYRLVDYKSVGEALTDLTKREDGPDFAFDAQRTTDGLALEYHMRVGDPYLGRDVGSWPVATSSSPVFDVEVEDDGEQIASHVWMQAGRTDSKVLIARARNDALLAAGYPVIDFVDTSRTDVTVQATLNQYAVENSVAASAVYRSMSFSVKGNPGAGPSLGAYRPGDFVSLDVAAGRLDLAEGLHALRITGISGDETGEDVKIECLVGGLETVS